MFKLRTFVAFGAGLAAAYFLDPLQGPRRRNEALRRIQGDVAPQARAKIRRKCLRQGKRSCSGETWTQRNAILGKC